MARPIIPIVAESSQPPVLTQEPESVACSKGAHDQPQSMCPAFGSLRVGLRMRRTSTILSGSACCVYGLTFTSHFYGARRSVGYVPFNSESLVTGKLFEDIREAVYAQADPEKLDAIVYPTSPRRPAKLNEDPAAAASTANSATNFANLTGFPDLIVPAGFTR